jgi:hypothetical protein
MKARLHRRDGLVDLLRLCFIAAGNPLDTNHSYTPLDRGVDLYLLGKESKVPAQKLKRLQAVIELDLSPPTPLRGALGDKGDDPRISIGQLGRVLDPKAIRPPREYAAGIVETQALKL